MLQCSCGDSRQGCPAELGQRQASGLRGSPAQAMTRSVVKSCAASGTVINLCGENCKFTGKERDTESGLDDFGARYWKGLATMAARS